MDQPNKTLFQLCAIIAALYGLLWAVEDSIVTGLGFIQFVEWLLLGSVATGLVGGGSGWLMGKTPETKSLYCWRGTWIAGSVLHLIMLFGVIIGGDTNQPRWRAGTTAVLAVIMMALAAIVLHATQEKIHAEEAR